MKNRLVLLCLLTALGMIVRAQSSQLEQLLQKYHLSDLACQPFARTALSVKDCEALSPYLLELWKDEVYEDMRLYADEGRIQSGNIVMPFESKDYGDVPMDGYSLFISLHGGGNVPEETNNQQWNNQLRLYQPQEGIYVAPRAPWNDWNMWFRSEIDDLLGRLVQWMVVSREVNPNRVYLMGYSAGGDGVWRLAPRMADRWAAASMMAGHPGNVRVENLLNLPFMIWMGAKDTAYKRNLKARRMAQMLDSLENAEPLTYVHESHILPDKGHWMDRVDTVAVTWMANFVRDPLPYHIVWQQEDVVHPTFYWLEVDRNLARRGMRVDVVRDENEIQILRCDYPKIRIYLNDDMMNLDHEVRVTYLGKTLFFGKLKRTLATMARTLSERGDENWMFSTYIDVVIN